MCPVHSTLDSFWSLYLVSQEGNAIYLLGKIFLGKYFTLQDIGPDV